MKKGLIVVACFMISLFLLIIFEEPITNKLMILGFFTPTPSDVEETYYRNESELLILSEFVSDLAKEYEIIRIEIFDSINIVELSRENKQGGYDNTTINISDKGIINALEILKEQGFIRILKESDYISFQVWGCFSESVDLLFSPGVYPNTEHINAKEKVVEKIKPNDWYYCKIIYE